MSFEEESQRNTLLNECFFSSVIDNSNHRSRVESFFEQSSQTPQQQDCQRYTITTNVNGQLKVIQTNSKCNQKQAFQSYQIEAFINADINSEKSMSNNQNNSIYTPHAFNKIFYESQPKRDQKSNKNFLKFFFPKFFMRMRETTKPNDAWYLFNQQYQNDKKTSTIKILAELFEGEEDQHGYKSRNRRFTHEMLKSRVFFQQYLFHSHYIKSKRNRKQYLLAAKMFAARCRSKQLAGRIQTK